MRQAEAYRAVNVMMGDDYYLLVLGQDGTALDPIQLSVLSRESLPNARTQYIGFCLADESEPKHGKPRLRPRGLTFTQENLGLMLVDSGIEVGAITDVRRYGAGCFPGVQGECLMARARLHRTVLADVAWRALREGVLSAACVVVDGWAFDARGTLIDGTVRHTQLVCREGACNRNTRVLELWEEGS